MKSSLAFVLLLFFAFPRLQAQESVSTNDSPTENPGASGNSNPGEVAELEELVAVGTRRRDRSLADSPVPVDLINPEELTTQGFVDVKSMLSVVAPSFNVSQSSISGASSLIVPANLRGLPPDSTLILINGKRRHRASVIAHITGGVSDGSQGADLSTIPYIAIKRVEILRDGTSAQYGSDAIAGVINFVLKDSASEGSVEARWGQYYEGDGNTYTVAANTGMPLLPGKERTGYANFSVEYSESKSTDRAIQRADAAALAPFAPLFAAAGHSVRDPVVNWGNPEFNYEIKLFGNLAAPLTDQAEVYFFPNFAERESDNSFFFRNPLINSQQGVFRGKNGHPLHHLVADLRANPDRATVPTLEYAPTSGVLAPTPDLLQGLGDVNTQHPDNRDPDNPTQPAFYAFNERFPAGFTPRFGAVITEYSLAGGIRGTLENGWFYDASAVVGQHDTEFLISNTINPQLLGHPEFAGNPNGIPTDYNPGSYTETDYTLNFDISRPFEVGNLDSPLYASAGLEYRVEKFKITPGDEYSWYRNRSMIDQGFSVGSSGFPGFQKGERRDRGNIAAYVDLEADVVQDLLLETAVRFEEFEDFGSTLNGKLASRWHVNKNLALRGSINTGFRAPTVGQNSYQTLASSFVDKGRGPELVTVAILPPSTPLAQELGSRPLEPEHSLNFSVGTAIKLNRINLTVDLYHIEVEDRISFTDYIPLSPEQQQTFFADHARYYFNAFDTTTQGIDIIADYPIAHSLGLTTLTLALNFNQTEIDRVHDNPNVTAITELRKQQIQTALPEMRFILGAVHNSGPWTVSSRLRYYGDYTEYHGDLFLFRHESDGKWLVDLEGSYDFDNGLSLAAGAQNLFDTYPSAVPALPASVTGSPYPIISPFGFNGGFFYFKATYRF